jgi:CBS domain containing-hemolysin-like protein
MTTEAHWPEIVVLVLLVAAAAFFAASEAAIVSLNRIRARALAEKNIRGARLLQRLLENRNRTLTSVLIGSTFVLLAADSLATDLFIHWNIPKAAIWSTIVMTVVLLLFGEILPKTIAVGSGERTALRLAPILAFVTRVVSPLTTGFLWITDSLVRLFGGTPHVGPYVTEDDIKTLVNVGVEQNVLEEEERELIHSIIEFGDTIAREVMTPRTDMVTVSVTSSPRRALDLVIADGYSKLPVWEESIDNIIGVVHDRELLISLANGSIASASLRSLMRPVKWVPETKRISELLREMQREKFSLAIVLDEYGGTAGLVTMEDLLEEIVGEIQDEYDVEEPMIERLSPDEVRIDGRVDVDELGEIFEIPLALEDADEYDTVGGLIFHRLGKVPKPGDEVRLNGLKLTVETTDGRRVGKVLAVRQRDPDDDADEDDR